MKVGGGPPTFQISVREAEIAFADQTRENVRVVYMDFRNWAGVWRINAKNTAIWQFEIDATPVQFLGKLKGR